MEEVRARARGGGGARIWWSRRSGTGFCGAVIRCEKTAEGLTVTLEDRFGKHRVFPMEPRGFLLEGRVGHPRPPAPAVPAPARPLRTASGSVAVPGARARVARAGRIYVEGRHDAELVERVWGDDLRVEGVVVEYLEGIDDLPAIVDEFAPGPDARLGVLVDHLVPGSKESRIASQVTGAHVLVVGHPYIDVWEAVKPSSVGIPAWPRSRAARTGRRACAGRWAGRRTRARPGSGSCPGAVLQGPGAGAAGPCGGTDRLRHGTLMPRGSAGPAAPAPPWGGARSVAPFSPPGPAPPRRPAAARAASARRAPSA